MRARTMENTFITTDEWLYIHHGGGATLRAHEAEICEADTLSKTL